MLVIHLFISKNEINFNKIEEKQTNFNIFQQN